MASALTFAGSGACALLGHRLGPGSQGARSDVRDTPLASPELEVCVAGWEGLPSGTLGTKHGSDCNLILGTRGPGWRKKPPRRDIGRPPILPSLVAALPQRPREQAPPHVAGFCSRLHLCRAPAPRGSQPRGAPLTLQLLVEAPVLSLRPCTQAWPLLLPGTVTCSRVWFVFLVYSVLLGLKDPWAPWGQGQSCASCRTPNTRHRVRHTVCLLSILSTF